MEGDDSEDSDEPTHPCLGVGFPTHTGLGVGFPDVGQEVREGLAAAESKKEKYEQTLALALTQYDRSTATLFSVNIRRFDRLAKALEFVQSARTNNMPLAVFARNKPRPDATRMVVKTVKEYLVAPYAKFWQYCQRVDYKVLLEECIRSDQPTYLYFDIEIKQLDHEDFPSTAFSELVREHVKLIGIELPPESLESIGEAYDSVCTEALTEGECRAGLEIMIDLIRIFLRLRTGVHEPHLRVVSGCRPSKLSFHVVCKGLLVDSNVGSMSLLVYEFARHFAVSNLEALRGDEFVFSPDDDRSRFRYRALMLAQAVTCLPVVEPDAGEPGDPSQDMFLEPKERWGFTGYDDTPIDEAVYSTNHLLRAPGACKLDSNVLRPVLEGIGVSCPLMVDTSRFSSVFPPTHEGYQSWLDHLVCAPRRQNLINPELECLLVGMKPSNSCPFARRWHSQVGVEGLGASHWSSLYSLTSYDSDGAFIRFVELRQTIREVRRLFASELRLAIEDDSGSMLHSHEHVNPDDIFMAEDGRLKAFRLFRPDEWLFHVHGARRERTPSAKVFFGGFRCFGCNTTFAVPHTTPWEPVYPFRQDEQVSSSDPMSFMPNLDWGRLLERKYVVIAANMGSGKTEQLTRLVSLANATGKYVLVLSFRRMLAVQQARRLGILCYLDLDADDLRASPRMLTLVLNSLLKLGHDKYDFVVLDECGLIRRHFFSSTMKVNMLPIYKVFTRLISSADHVVMLQDGITRDDVQFHTDIENIDCEDRSHVSAFCFNKPVHIHPLKFTTDLYVALGNLLKCYSDACIADGDIAEGMFTQVRHPFMVLCNSAVLAEFIVTQLRAEAVKRKADPNRIQGLWARIKDKSDFGLRFQKDPNEVAEEVDAVVCTSVIGAGFSINRHFEAFHAFFLTDILVFEEEKQFLQRLRWLLEACPLNAIRQSYLYVQKGHGNEFEYERVLVNFNTVRKVLLKSGGRRGQRRALVDTAANETLAETHARIETEKAASRSLHDELWRRYGADKLQSDFEELETTEEESLEAAKAMKPVLLKWARQRTKDIKTFMDLLGSDDIDAHLAAVRTLGGSTCACGSALWNHLIILTRALPA